MFLQRAFEERVVQPAFAKEVEFSRGLTQDERALARGVYGFQFDLDKVRIHKGCLLHKYRDTVDACVVGNNIFFTREAYRDDFSTADFDERALFVHELQHVNQSQHGVSLPFEFFKLLIATRGNYDEAYKLPAESRDFKDYNIEQQAVIVTTAYDLSEMLKDENLTPPQRERISRDLGYFMALLPPSFAEFEKAQGLAAATRRARAARDAGEYCYDP